MEKEIISPYVYIGIPKASIPLKFRNAIKQLKSKYTQEMIISSIEEVLGISYTEMQSKYRFRQLVEARQMYCYFMKTNMKWTFLEIGRSIGGRDHSTVMHNVNCFNDLCFSDDEYNIKATEIKKRIEWKSHRTI